MNIEDESKQRITQLDGQEGNQQTYETLPPITEQNTGVPSTSIFQMPLNHMR